LLAVTGIYSIFVPVATYLGFEFRLGLVFGSSR